MNVLPKPKTKAAEDDSAGKSFVRGLPSETAVVVEKLREAVRASMPDYKEIVYHGALGYTPTGSPWDRIIYIGPASRHVTFGFFFGGLLKDPAGLLEGEGARMRHVKVRTVSEAENPDLVRLVAAAAADAPGSLLALRKKRGW